jgi:hypothetical protein
VFIVQTTGLKPLNFSFLLLNFVIPLKIIGVMKNIFTERRREAAKHMLLIMK